jgi:hypothetical protein
VLRRRRLSEARSPSGENVDLCFKDADEAGVTHEFALLTEAQITATLRLPLLFLKHARAHSSARSVLLHQLCVTIAFISSTIAAIVVSSEPRRAESPLMCGSCGLNQRSSRDAVDCAQLRCAGRRREKAVVHRDDVVLPQFGPAILNRKETLFMAPTSTRE